MSQSVLLYTHAYSIFGLSFWRVYLKSLASPNWWDMAQIMLMMNILILLFDHYSYHHILNVGDVWMAAEVGGKEDIMLGFFSIWFLASVYIIFLTWHIVLGKRFFVIIVFFFGMGKFQGQEELKTRLSGFYDAQ